MLPIHKLQGKLHRNWASIKRMNYLGKKFVDLGSGDGRMTIFAAQQGMFATGYEINHVYVYK
jgi:ubiquinone/menaquinone biosynthesis C-methylase UbiE